MTPHDTGSTGTPGTPRATAPPARTFGPQGPTLGELSDAYLQDYHVRQFRSPSTARGRIAHLVAFFGRDARAAALTTYQIRQYQLARRAAGAATGTINRETSALHRMCTLAVHWGWLDTVPGFPDRLPGESPPPGLLRAPRIPRRPRPPARPVAGHPRSRLLLWLAQERDPRPHLGRDSTKRAASSGSRPPVRRRWWGGFSRSHTPLPRPSPDGGHAATPTARWSSTATASPSAAGARRGAPPVRRPACRPASFMIAAAPPPAT